MISLHQKSKNLLGTLCMGQFVDAPCVAPSTRANRLRTPSVFAQDMQFSILLSYVETVDII